jgi:HeH/LEM domain
MELTKWVKIRRQTFIKGELAEVDDVVQVDDKDFVQLTTGTKKAIPCDAPKAKKKIEPKLGLKTMTVPKLRDLLDKHNVDYDAKAKKNELVTLAELNIEPHEE